MRKKQRCTYTRSLSTLVVQNVDLRVLGTRSVDYTVVFVVLQVCMCERKWQLPRRYNCLFLNVYTNFISDLRFSRSSLWMWFFLLIFMIIISNSIITSPSFSLVFFLKNQLQLPVIPILHFVEK